MALIIRRLWLPLLFCVLAALFLLVLVPINRPSVAQSIEQDHVYPSVPISYGSVVHIETRVERDDSGKPTSYDTDIYYQDSAGVVRRVIFQDLSASGEFIRIPGTDVFPRHE